MPQLPPSLRRPRRCHAHADKHVQTVELSCTRSPCAHVLFGCHESATPESFGLSVPQQPDEEDGAALSGALCALAEAHMHADVEQAGPRVEVLLREAVQLGASPEPLQV